ncbi:molybdopterin-dependent oxidoreductase [Chloroflexota bacterium]
MANREITQPETVFMSGACHDCGGKCVHKVHVRDGKILRIETDDGKEPQYRSCLKGRAYRQRVYAPDRLKFPMKRAGARGEGKFQRISWDEALDTVATELNRIKESYGPSAILYVFGTGSPGLLHSSGAIERLLYMFDGCTIRWGSNSAEGSRFASRATYGTLATGHHREDLINARLILMWGWNPAVSTSGTNTSYYLAQAKEAGTRIISIDPKLTESTAVFAHRWLPIRPCTDTAMMIAMAYVIIKNNLQDQRFIDTYTMGFDQFKKYVLGIEDGIPKTPSWAEIITGVPATDIENLARDYSTTKPAVLMPGYAAGRTAYGEQFHRAAATLTALTGNIGIHGGNPAGHGLNSHIARFPVGNNPVERGAPSLDNNLDCALRSRYKVHSAKIWDALLKGKAGGYPADFKLLYVTNSNCLNQYLNTNKGVEALQKLEFIIVHEQFMSATAKFADVLLPVNTHLERNEFFQPHYPDHYYIYGNKVIDSLYETKSDFDIAVELAPHLGVQNYSNNDEEEWLREFVKVTGDIPDYDEFKKKGTYKVQIEEPAVAFKLQIEDPENNPFPTPSGKIEIYSQRLADLNHPEIPPIPKYIDDWEGPNDSLTTKYPLQLITRHTRRRANSCFDNIPWLKETEPQAVTISSVDAQARGINDGDQVRVSNDRGELIIPAQVTERIMPGVVDIGQGAWFAPDEKGVDRGGCPNVLSKDEHSPGGAFPYNTCLVQVEKA